MPLHPLEPELESFTNLPQAVWADPDTPAILNIVKAEVKYNLPDKVALQTYINEIRASNFDYQPGPPTVAEHTHEPESIYQPLTGPLDIRVLELYPGKFDDEIQGCLHVVSIAFEYQWSDYKGTGASGRYYTHHAMSHITYEPVWYTAISYTWGDSTLCKPIKCGGKRFLTTVNLDQALRYLRQTESSVMIWADQICINQQDLEEKSRQVLLMDRIYSRSWSTIVWLGEESDGSSDAIETLETIADIMQYYPDDTSPDVADFERLSLPLPGAKKWSNLSVFLERPWFQRVWVIQEIAFSSRIQFMYGKKFTSWFSVSLFANCMIKHDLTQYLELHNTDALNTAESACSHVDEIDGIKGYKDSIQGGSSLLGLLVQTRRAQATDPRDKVFALLGLSSEQVYPDYTSAASKIYTAAAKTTLPDHVLDLLSCVDHLEPEAGRPSWVPDWSSPRQTVSFGYGGFGHGVYRANNDRQAQSSRIQRGGDVLVMAGLIFDDVVNVTPLAGSSCLQDIFESTSETRSFLLESIELAQRQCQPYPSGQGLFDAFWHTLVAGKDGSGLLVAPADFAPVFALLVDSITSSSPSLPDQPSFKRKLTLDNLNFRRPKYFYRELQKAFQSAVKGRVFGTTSKRYIGLFPRGTRSGDKICVLLGGPVPFIVRPHCAAGSYQLIGECFVHGIMNGEVIQSTCIQAQDISFM